MGYDFSHSDSEEGKCLIGGGILFLRNSTDGIVTENSDVEDTPVLVIGKEKRELQWRFLFI